MATHIVGAETAFDTYYPITRHSIMIFDSLDLPDEHVLQSDLCIIGSGAAAIAMALELAGGAVDLLILEGGGKSAEPNSQSLYAGSVADERLHTLPDRYRQRRFGGTTTIWGGRCMPFDAIDFQKREYVRHSGWPLSLNEILPHYPRANRLCEAGEFAYTAESAFHRKTRPIITGFESDNFTSNTLERFSCPTDFGARYGRKLETAANVRLLLHANVTHLQLNDAGTAIAEVTVRNFQGKRILVRARQYVLATGGLETARLLLASRDIHPNGIGNDGDIVGRFYMCHLAGTIGTIKIAGPSSSVWHGYEIADDGTYCRRRFALQGAAQQRLKLGNFVARLHHPRITDPQHRSAVLSMLFLAKYFIPYEYRVRLHGTEPTTVAIFAKHLLNVLTGPAEVAAFGVHMLRDRKLAARKFPSIIVRSKANVFSLDFHAEQQPNPASRVTLGTERDDFGMPRLHVDWRYTPEDVDTVARSVALFAEELRRQKLGTFDYDPQQLEAEMTRYGAYGGHHIGTARMGLDRRTSVVDPNCRVHGVANLYVAGSAVFPTSSQANPTLTVVALSLRLAAHLSTLLQRRSEQRPAESVAPC